jgi:Leucine-rich repeat (LRR) protein
MQEYSEQKLINLLQDLKNMDQNSLFIQIFPAELVDEVWNSLNTSTSQKTEELRTNHDLFCLFLIAFSIEGSLPSKIRSGDLYWPNRYLPGDKTLFLNDQFEKIPQGVVSQLILILSIEKLVFESEAAIRSAFDLDFQIVENQIKSCCFYDIESDYQLNSLFISQHLEVLKFIRCKGAILPSDLSKLRAISKIEFRNCVLKKLPVFNMSLSTIKTLVFNKSIHFKLEFLTQLPKGIMSLDLSMNKLTEIKGLHFFSSLKELNLSGSSLSNFEFEDLPQKIEKLNLRDNQLSNLSFSKMKQLNLTYLDISHNKISEIPKEIGLLVSLKEFLCSHNKMSQLPYEMGDLKNLHRLDARKNNIQKIPTSLSKIDVINYLDLEDNLLKEFYDFIKMSSFTNAYVRLRGNDFSNYEKLRILSLEKVKIDI